MAIVCGVAVLAGIACRLGLNVVHYDIESDKITAPVKIAFLSDVHNSLYGKGQSELITAISEFGTDIVLFGGDLFDEHNGEGNSWALVDALAGEYPCFYTVGNHEYKTRIPEHYKDEMAGHGVTVLDDETEVVEINGQKIRICGTEFHSDKNAVSQLDDLYSIDMHHFPEDFPIMKKKGFDLILAGHAHGGQWRIPYLVNGIYAPGEGFLPKYAGGYYSENGTEMIVSRGLYKNLSCLFIPRVFNRPELVLITLK
ncbi:MAG: metallophosphoesterase [Oscillospiraceae bacterium]|nr:metallophosphoesterase [Oscillospiraceae bacterium]